MGKGKGPKFLLSILLLIAISISAFRYYEYVIQRNFTLQVNSTCDVADHHCFVSDCKVGDPGCDTSAYEKVTIIARNAPACLEEHSCTSFNCTGKSSCSIEYCTAATSENGEKCTQPSE